MTCLEFWVWFGSGVFLVPLLAFLKKLPSVGPVIDQWAWLVAPLLAAILPQIGNALAPYCAVIDPALWAIILAALSYLVSQLEYWILKKLGVPV